MATSSTSLLERIARVFAGQSLSANAEGSATSAALDVNIEWEGRIEDALAILKASREPDEAMASAGDEKIWQNMVMIALEQASHYE